MILINKYAKFLLILFVVACPAGCAFVEFVPVLAERVPSIHNYIQFVRVVEWFYNIILFILPMKSLFILIIVLLDYIEAKTFHCAFHQYAHSNHYQSRKARPEDMFRSHLESIKQQSKPHRRALYGAGRPPMRITLNTDEFDAAIQTTLHGEPQTTAQRLAFIKRAMQVTEVFFESRLKVSSQGLLSIPSSCFDFAPPATDVRDGVSGSDLHIYVKYLTDNTKGYGATGVSCQWNALSNIADTSLKAGRPTVGRIIFNTFNIIDSKGTLTNRLFAAITATSLHETIHILGFDQNLYSDYLDSNTGLPYAQVTEAVNLNAARTGGVNHIMKTPSVTAWAIQHFGCNSITGMVLENQQTSPSTGVPGSHWQRLTMYDELMTGTQLGPQKSITALTFALLKDMGWYGVDDVFNDTTNYGKNLGCSFYFDACYSSSTFDKYFCNPANNVNVTSCSTTFTGKATCSNQAALMADGCGMYMEHFNCVDPSVTGDFYQSFTLESFGTNVFCAKGTISTAGITTNYRGRCYPFACNYTDQSIKFTISSSYTLYCFSNEQGTNKTVSGMQGVFQCPVFADFCTNSRKICPNWCSSRGLCTRGVCNCYFDENVTYSGEDCSISTCVAANTYYHSPTSSCVPTCPSGYYASVLSKACLKCDVSCSECRDESTICTSCTSTPASPQYYYVAGARCVSACPADTFLQVDTCISCDTVTAGCATCTGSSTTCLSCVDPAKYLNELNQCVTTCTGTYNKYDAINKMCRQTCPNDLVLSGTSCVRCAPQYKKIDEIGNTCYPSCPPQYYTDPINYICGNCDTTCKQCYGQYSQNCTSCWSNGTNNYLHLDMCLSVCPGGFYAHPTLYKCEICTLSLHCATCSLDAGNNVLCTSCKYGYYLQTNGTCTTGCDSTYYPNKWNHSCDPCHNDCKDCNGPYETSCLNCNTPNYYLKNSTGGYCLAGCPPVGYLLFMSTTCLACHQTCSTCINETSSGCATCSNGLYLQNNKCRYVCSPLMYPDETTKTCLGCDGKCKFCFGNTVDNCTKCATGFVLNNFTCTTSCQQGQTANAYNVCEKKSAFQNLMTFWMAILLLMMGVVWL